jgi:ABC-type sugar transport system permease subunit
MYLAAFEEGDWGMVSAMGVLIGVVSAIVLLLYYRLTRFLRRGTAAGR